jgi:O-acetyl-ADP-ribose deacetylase (regulator of RNase III)
VIEPVRADITNLRVDAIVNAANSSLAGGAGDGGATPRAAGPRLAEAATRLAPCPAGEAMITPGFDLAARFVIHAVGPIWYDGTRGEPDTLRRTYESAFRVARQEGSIRSIAFPAISTGAYGFPKPLAAEIAVEVMRRHAGDFDRIVACLFDETSLELYLQLVGAPAGRRRQG